MTLYNTIFRVEDYNEHLNLVWVYMIAWQDDPFWYPAEEFIKASNKEVLKTATEHFVLRFIGDANIYADRVEDLEIQELVLNVRYSGGCNEVSDRLLKDLQ